MRLWIRFYGGIDGDYRPTYFAATHPSGPTFEWWCVGSREGEPEFIICAMVDAPTEADGIATVRSFWPEAEGLTCDVHAADWLPGDRFLMSGHA